MPIDIQTLTRLKRKLEDSKAEAAKAEGAFENALALLKKDYDVNSTDEAKAKLAEFEVAATQAEKKFEEKLAQFKERFPDALPS